jgi:glycine cleavage system aminomethyltransferase T
MGERGDAVCVGERGRDGGMQVGKVAAAGASFSLSDDFRGKRHAMEKKKPGTRRRRRRLFMSSRQRVCAGNEGRGWVRAVKA